LLSPDTCLACAAVTGRAPPPAGPSRPDDMPLCSICRQRISEQPQPIPGYQIIRELGRGGMGIVYLALHSAGGSIVALKTIKPGNLLVTEVNGHEDVKLVDFGLARVYQASKLSGLTLEGQVAGTAPFMAPEQIHNFREAKPPVDQYAAAATLYNLLTDKYVH